MTDDSAATDGDSSPSGEKTRPSAVALGTIAAILERQISVEKGLKKRRFPWFRRGAAGPAKALSSSDLVTSHRSIALRDHQNLVGLRGTYGRRTLWLVIGQVVVADLVFVAYAWFGQDWHLPESVISVWLGATVVQVVGLAAIVTKSLFPSDGHGKFSDPKPASEDDARQVFLKALEQYSKSLEP